MIELGELKAIFEYEASSGLFYRRRSGEVAGSIRPDGYIIICINKKRYKAHRLAWFYVYGVWPSGDIDHIDRNSSNNRIKNLRDVTRAENMQNRRRAHINNKTGFLGVNFDKQSGRFRATIRDVNSKKLHLGLFATPELAHEAYVLAKRKLHPTCSI